MDAYVELYAGGLGSGKSYAATLEAVGWLRRGKVVCTTLTLHPERVRIYIKARWDVDVPPENIRIFPLSETLTMPSVAPRGSIVILDEVARVIDQWSHSEASVREFCRWLAMVRHHGIRVVLIAQHPDNVVSGIRRLIQYVWGHRDMRQYRLPGIGLRWPLSSLKRSMYERDFRTLIYSRHDVWDKKIWTLYDSYDCDDSYCADDVRQKPGLGCKKTMTRQQWIVILLLVGLAGWLPCYRLRRAETRLSAELSSVRARAEKVTVVEKSQSPGGASSSSMQIRPSVESEAGLPVAGWSGWWHDGLRRIAGGLRRCWVADVQGAGVIAGQWVWIVQGRKLRVGDRCPGGRILALREDGGLCEGGVLFARVVEPGEPLPGPERSRLTMMP